MPTDKTWNYDADSETVWVDRTALSGETLIRRDELQPWIEALAGKGDLPGPVTTINYLFADATTAAYNRDNLAFARVATWLKGEDGPTPFDPDGAPDFQAREDFGIA